MSKDELSEFASLMVDEIISRVRVQLDAGEGLSVADQRHMLEQLITERSRLAATRLEALQAQPVGEELAVEAARAALRDTEIARTDVVKPANGAAPYSFVRFHGECVKFYDGEWDNSFERDAGTGKAAAYAQKINDGLFELAKAAARNALTASPPVVEREAIAREVLRMRESANNWRRPSLAQVEGPNDLKIYGGTIADDFDRWADMLEALSSNAAPSRQAIAEIIDPRAFSSVGNTHLKEAFGRGPRDREAALAKADAILALTPVSASPDTPKRPGFQDA